MTSSGELSPFARIGGREGVSAVANAFYDIIDRDPAFSELRRMHAEDLRPMRDSLAGFLSGWMGGPRDWFVANPGKCMMSLHGELPISKATADQWLLAMKAALRAAHVDSELAEMLNDAFGRMAGAMARMAV